MDGYRRNRSVSIIPGSEVQRRFPIEVMRENPEHMNADIRSCLYGFFSKVYFREPTLVFLKQLQSPDLKNILDEFGTSLGLEGREVDQALLDELAVEYTRLFLGPGPHISPHESVHLSPDTKGQLWGNETVQVKKFIEGCGMTADTTFIPDHVSIELELMCRLSQREEEARRDQDRETVKESLLRQDRFLKEHLALWFPIFSKKVCESAKLPFYQEVSRIAAGFIRQESEETVPRCISQEGF